MFTDTLQMNKRCVIIGAAPIQTGASHITPDDHVIVCDGGLAYAQAAQIPFHVLLGDFDSWTQPIPEGNFETIKLPTEKDDTDLMFAVKLAVSRGYTNFLLLGVLGGRSDHFLGNLAVGTYIARQGGFCALLGDGEVIYVLHNNSLTLTPRVGTTVSVLPLGNELRHVTLTGLYYPLEDATLTNDFPLGVSNKITQDQINPVIHIGEGTAAIIISQ